MKKLILIALFLLSASVCFAEGDVGLKAVAQEDASLAWDFGMVKAGEVVKHDFTLKNDSAKTLNISGINTSCGCTVSEIKKRVLAPGESTTIEVKFNSKGYSGEARQYIFVNTDSLDKPVIRYMIKAEVGK